jgi:hypothetical protein
MTLRRQGAMDFVARRKSILLRKIKSRQGQADCHSLKSIFLRLFKMSEALFSLASLIRLA